MPAFPSNWSPAEVGLLVTILSGAVCLLALILAVLRYNLRALADATALKREYLNAEVALKRDLIQRGLPVEEMEKAIQLLKLEEPPAAAANRPPSTLTGGQLDAEIVEHLALLEGVSPDGIEQVISLVRVADRDGKEAARVLLENLQAKKELEGIETQGEVVLAAVRSLCRPSEKPREEAKLPLELSSRITR
jgi:hypothetical protein